MIHYKIMNAMDCSVDWDTDLFNIVTGGLQGDTLVSYLFMLFQDYVLQTSIDLIKENGFTLKKARSRWYSTETPADYADDLVLLANTPT